jgi:hypothetical protein
MATLGYFKPGVPAQTAAAVKSPAPVVAVGPAVTPSIAFLADARPNPSRTGTAIRFEIGRQQHVSLGIYDSQGRLVKNLVDRTESVGAHEVTWDGRDEDGVRVAPGVYYYRIDAGGFRTGKSLVIVE